MSGGQSEHFWLGVRGNISAPDSVVRNTDGRPRAATPFNNVSTAANMLSGGRQALGPKGILGGHLANVSLPFSSFYRCSPDWWRFDRRSRSPRRQWRHSHRRQRTRCNNTFTPFHFSLPNLAGLEMGTGTSTSISRANLSSSRRSSLPSGANGNGGNGGAASSK